MAKQRGSNQKAEVIGSYPEFVRRYLPDDARRLLEDYDPAVPVPPLPDGADGQPPGVAVGRGRRRKPPK